MDHDVSVCGYHRDGIACGYPHDEKNALLFIQIILEEGVTPRAVQLLENEHSVKYAIDMPIYINDPDIAGRTLLHQAACHGHISCIDWLVGNGADINRKTKRLGFYWSVPLEVALHRRQERSALRLIDLKADIHYQNSEGYTLLMTAISYGNRLVVQKLLESRADPNRGNSDGLTPLAMSVTTDYSQLLLAYRANVQNVDVDGWTVLHAAAYNMTSRPPGLFIEHRADVNATDHENQTPLAVAIDYGHVRQIESLLSYRATMYTDYEIADQSWNEGRISFLLANCGFQYEGLERKPQPSIFFRVVNYAKQLESGTRLLRISRKPNDKRDNKIIRTLRKLMAGHPYHQWRFFLVSGDGLESLPIRSPANLLEVARRHITMPPSVIEIRRQEIFEFCDRLSPTDRKNLKTMLMIRMVNVESAFSLIPNELMIEIFRFLLPW